MNNAQPRPITFRFGVFELDLRSGELARNGQRVHLQEKPFLALALLLERAGDVVTREELRERLWPSDTFVEFDDNLNSTVKRIREALGDSADGPRYIQTVPRRGYRFIPPVEAVYPVIEAPVKRSKAWIAAVAAVAVVLAGAAYLWKTRASASHGKIMMAVLPFRNVSGDAAQDYLSDGITEELIAHLGRLSPSKLGVVSVSSAMHYKNSSEDVAKIGAQLDANYILEGSVRRTDARIDITVQLVQTSDRTHLWAETYSPSSLELSTLHRDVSRGVAEALAIRLLPSESTVLARAATTNTAAYDSYLAGVYQWNRGTKDSFQAALGHFQHAADLDPGYALAHSGMAKCYMELGDYRLIPPVDAIAKAKEESSLAMKLDDTIPDSHAVAAAVLDRSDASAAGVDEGYRRAIELNPSDARARRGYAVYLMYHHRGPQAVSQIAEAVRLDPMSPSVHSYASWIYYSTDDFKRSWQQSRQAIELDPNFPFALYVQGHLYEHDGKHDDAIAQYQKAVASSGRTPKYLYALGRAYLSAGKRDAARQVLGELQAQAKSGYVPADYLQQLSQKLGT